MAAAFTASDKSDLSHDPEHSGIAGRAGWCRDGPRGEVKDPAVVGSRGCFTVESTQTPTKMICRMRAGRLKGFATFNLLRKGKIVVDCGPKKGFHPLKT